MKARVSPQKSIRRESARRLEWLLGPPGGAPIPLRLAHHRLHALQTLTPALSQRIKLATKLVAPSASSQFLTQNDRTRASAGKPSNSPTQYYDDTSPRPLDRD